MGLIRGALLFIVTSLLMFSLVSTNLFLTLGLSFDSEGVKSELSSTLVESAFDESALSSEIDSNLEFIQSNCEEGLDYSLPTSLGNILISCETANQGTEAIVQEIVESQLNNSLEKFTESEECLTPGCTLKILLSDDGDSYWYNLFYITLIISLLLIVIKFILTPEKINFPIQLGFLIIIATLPFIVIDFMSDYFEKSILSPLTVIFSEAYSVFIISATIGSIFVVMGLGLKFYTMGSSISSRFQKVKEFFTWKKTPENTTSNDTLKQESQNIPKKD